MRKFYLLAIVLFLSASCKKYSQVVNPAHPDIVGRWVVSDYYSSPGGGVNMNSIPWIPVGNANIWYIEFKKDSNFINSQDMQAIPDLFQLTDSLLYIIRGNQKIQLEYKISKSYLEIYGLISFGGNCIEFCGTRFIPAK